MIRGFIAATFIGANTMLACIPLFAMVLIRLPLLGGWRAAMSRHMDWIIDYWVGCNRWLFRTLGLCRVTLASDDLQHLHRDRWYLIICNHQSWTDIVLLQTELLHHLPPIKFFTKSQLKWLPFLGAAMMALGFPYVRRVSAEQIARNPELKGLDRRSTLQACEGLSRHPTAVLNFLEGTRFSPSKHAAQTKPRFNRLLNPKIGGLQYVLEGMGKRLDGLVDITITYPDHDAPSFWDFLCGRCASATMSLRLRPVPDELLHAEAEQMRPLVAKWTDEMWQDKDLELMRS